MRVALGTLARTGLEEQAGADLATSVNAALVYWVKKTASGRAMAPFPDFLPAMAGPNGDGGGDATVAIEIEVDAELEAELAREAAELETTVPELARHAVLVYLAEFDLIAGRLSSCEGRRRR